MSLSHLSQSTEELHDSEMPEIVSDIFVSINYNCIFQTLPYSYVHASYERSR